MKRPQFSREIQWLLEGKYKGRKGESFARDIERLRRGEHVDYVIGFVDFLECRINLSQKPFIPRPETEYWIKEAIEDMQSRDCPYLVGTVPTLLRVLDLFAGSGCVGVAVLKHIPQAVVDFAEKDKRLLSQIRFNARENGIEQKRYRVIQSDIFSGVKNKKYDFIFANPPYIAESKRRKVQSSVLKNEPKEALFAGKDGLDIIQSFLSEAKEFLTEKGKIYLEFDSFQKPLIAKILRSCGFRHFKFHKDQYGKWRFVVVRKEF